MISKVDQVVGMRCLISPGLMRHDKKRLVTGASLAWLDMWAVDLQVERIDQVVGMRCLISLGLIST
ncbi:MAG: hypothetical protein A2W85_12465 [Bacteroidetes bacterium GWF2_41_31]|nr:MAG: hypothetical protein A2W85_12465 [Bacteroidetes bacterium GWF2_41_31]